MTSVVAKSIFKEISNSGDGGVFRVTDKNLNITCCVFESTFCTNRGGSLFLSNCKLNINRTTFSRCYTSAYTNGIYGNSIYINQNSANLECISTYLCGPSAKLCSDSSIYVETCVTKIKFYNSSNNYGIGGSSAVRITYSVDGSDVRYINSDASNDLVVFESCSNLVTIYNSNVVNITSANRYIYWTDKNNVIAFNGCIFWDCTVVNIACSNTQCTFTNCYSNSITGISTTTKKKLNEITFVIICTDEKIIKIYHTCRINRPLMLLA